jgi:hypothetical protein
MAVSIICCCAPVFKPLLPEQGFWSRLTSKVSVSALRGSKDRGTEGQSSVRSLNTDGSAQRRGWSQLETESTKGLAWPAPHEMSAGATKDVALEDIRPLDGNIHVKRSVDQTVEDGRYRA